MTPDALLPEPHWRVLDTVVARVPPEEALWALTGSASFRLRGIDVPVGDLDLQTGREGAAFILARLEGRLLTPLSLCESERLRSYFAAFEAEGIRVEVMADLQKRLPGGGWGPPVEILDHLRWVEHRGLRIPVLDLAYEARAYAWLGRSERAKLLERAGRERDAGSRG